MRAKIEAILLDTGNTLTMTVTDIALQTRVMQELIKLLDDPRPPAEVEARLEEHYDAYKQWVKQTMVEPSEMELWTRWMVPEMPAGKITPIATRLTDLWVRRKGQRTARPDLHKTIVELNRRGYALGIIANALSTIEIPEWLEKEGLKQDFKAIVLSSTFGRRKPDPYIFLEAARLAGAAPEACAYVGDNPNRDIPGARQAGYGKVITFLESKTLNKESPTGGVKPDAIITNLRDLLNIFPPLQVAP